ncbi:MAG: hypothetical protein ACI30S_04935 [Muribaculaceae bacterium]
MKFLKNMHNGVDTIKRDSPSHDVLCLFVTRRRRYAPCLVFTHDSMLSEPAGCAILA